MKFIFFVLLSLYTLKSFGQKGDHRPNIVLILADDMGYSDPGCYGGEMSTPNIDGLAAQGIRFTNIYNAARCCPSRASLLTGLYPHQAGIGNMVYRDQGEGYRGYLKNNTVTLAEVLKDAGYRTLMSGKWHVGHKDPDHWPSRRGFDSFYGIHSHVDSYWKVLEGSEVFLNGDMIIPATDDPVHHLFPKKEWYTTEVFTDHAIQFLNETATEGVHKPFFLYMAYNAPHFPLEAPLETIEKYRGTYMEGWEKLRKEKFRRMKKMGVIPEKTRLPEYDGPGWDSLSLNDKNNLDFRRAIYAAQIEELDWNIGRLTDHLKSLGVYDNTLIIFLSDNGCSAEDGLFGMHWEDHRITNFEDWKKEGGWSVSQGQAWANVSNVPFRLYKKYTHQGGIATPFIMSWPAEISGKGSINSGTGHIMDVMATLADVAHARYPENYSGHPVTPMEGKSLWPLLDDENQINHEYLYWEHIGNRAIRYKNWKLVSTAGSPWELYNLRADPSETRDSIHDKKELAGKLKLKYRKWADRVGVKQWPIKNNNAKKN